MFESSNIPELAVILGLVFVFLELIIGIESGFDLVLIGSILLLSGFAGIGTSNFLLTLILTSLLSLFYILYGRSRVKQKIISLTHKTNIDKLIGSTGKVIKTIFPHDPGLVKLDDEVWRAEADSELLEGRKIIVTGVEGVTLRVGEIKKQ